MAEKNAIDKIDNEPSAPSQQVSRSYYAPSERKIHDSNVTFEEYHYYAQRTREEQRLLPSPQWQWRTVFSSKKKPADAVEEKHEAAPSAGGVITEEEWSNASRAFRTASWGAVFYLVGNFPKLYSLLTI